MLTLPFYVDRGLVLRVHKRKDRVHKRIKYRTIVYAYPFIGSEELTLDPAGHCPRERIDSEEQWQAIHPHLIHLETYDAEHGAGEGMRIRPTNPIPVRELTGAT